MFGTKKKLMAAVVMLVISAIMMTSASYAWFTISTNPEIGGMDAQVVVNENLEIALVTTGETAPTTLPVTGESDSGTQTTWGNIIDLSVADAGLTKTLRPITYVAADKKFKYPVYGDDGRISSLGVLEDTTYGLGNLVKESTTDKYAYYVDFWVRTNQSGENALKLQTAAGVKRSSEGITGLGSCIWMDGKDSTTEAKVNLLAKGIRIAFKDMTPSIEGATAAASGAAPIITVPSQPAQPANMDGTDAYAITLENNNIVTLTQNSAKLIRMYIYYDGKDLKNADAFLGELLVEAKLNIQFAVDGVDTSMDKF